MNLTSLVKVKEIREEMRKHIHIPTLSNENVPILVQPKHDRYAIVGTAFDYALRILVRAKFPKAYNGMWVAQQACVMADRNGENPVTVRKMIEVVDRAIDVFAQRRISDEFASSALNLANLDMYIRTGQLPKYIPYEPTAMEIQDIKQLCAVALKQFPFPAKSCFLNPVLGIHGCGADADLIVDGTLIDIKTTKNYLRYQDHVYQIVGYNVLLKINDGLIDDEPAKIERVGFYFSRHGHMETWPIEEIIKPGAIKKLAEFFEDYLQERMRDTDDERYLHDLLDV